MKTHIPTYDNLSKLVHACIHGHVTWNVKVEAISVLFDRNS
jgi:hypothetical protein